MLGNGVTGKAKLALVPQVATTLSPDLVGPQRRSPGKVNQCRNNAVFSYTLWEFVHEKIFKIFITSPELFAGQNQGSVAFDRTTQYFVHQENRQTELQKVCFYNIELLRKTYRRSLRNLVRTKVRAVVSQAVGEKRKTSVRETSEGKKLSSNSSSFSETRN